jgi:dTDP-4-amino-4,6-dideoxygalactose transaminase
MSQVEVRPLQVPLLDLQAQYRPIRAEILEAVTRVCDSQRFILGPEVQALERELAEQIGVGHAVGVSSGTDALLVSMMALGIGAGDEVITTPYSFFATAGCITRLGARPVFVDVDPTTYNLDASAVESVMTPRTKAILVVHLFGLPARMDPMLAIAARHGIPVIEDACQAIGARLDGRPAGGMGALGCFSFFPSKNLGGFGDGGLVTTNDDELAEAARVLRHHGQTGTYEHARVGGNFRLDEIQAAVLRVKARYLAAWTEARRANARRYLELFSQAGLDGVVVCPREPDGTRHVYNQFVVRVSDRDSLRGHLDARGIGTAVYYPAPCHLQPCFESLGYRLGDYPEAERAARETLALPVYPELTAEQQAHVVRSIAEFVRGT